MNRLGTPLLDEEIISTSTKMDEARMAGILTTVKCFALGYRATKTHMISVAIHPGFEDTPRPTDLYVDRYLGGELTADVRVFHLDSWGKTLTRWPPSASTLLEDFWAIFVGPKSDSARTSQLNDYLYSLFKDDLPERVNRGNVVAVKCDRFGKVIDICAEDTRMVQYLVYNFLKDGPISRPGSRILPSELLEGEVDLAKIGSREWQG